MFPLNSNMAYIKDNGERDKLGNVIGSGGGGGGSMTPDYENEILVVGTVDSWKYFIPMSKEYVGDGIIGYEITTDPQSSSSTAMINLYSIIYKDDEILYKSLIKRLIHNADKDYEDDNISVTYTGNQWAVTLKVPMYNTEGTAYTSPVAWNYHTTVDYVFLLQDPTS